MPNEEFVINSDLKYRQICAVLIQDLGIMHNVSQSLINTAIVYMHKLYEKFSYKDLKPVYVAMTSFYLASKSEDCARKLNDIVKSVYQLAGKQIDNNSERVVAAVHALESIMLMSVGFPKLDFKHPHVIILQLTKMYEMSVQFYESAYYICTAMLHLTTLITRFSTEEISAAAIYVASKWDYLKLKDICSRQWFKFINPNLNLATIQEISREFLEIYVKTPTRLKMKAVQFLKRFNNKSEPIPASTSSSRTPRQTPRPLEIESSVTKEVEKPEQLEEGEIDLPDDKGFNNGDDCNQANKRLSLHQYYQRKEDSTQKPSPNDKCLEMPKSYSQSSLTTQSHKRRMGDGSSRSGNPVKMAKQEHFYGGGQHHRKPAPESVREFSSHQTKVEKSHSADYYGSM